MKNLRHILLVGLSFAALPAFATTYYVGGNDPGSNWWAGSWANLQAAVNTAGSGDVVKVCGNITRSTGDTDGSVTLANPGVTMSGGWNSNFTGRAWSPGGRLSDELKGYSVLDANGSDSGGNQYRVLTISNTAANAKIEGFALTRGFSVNAAEYCGGCGGGAGVFAWGARLSHLYIYSCRSRKDYDSCGGVYVTSGGAVLEYLTVTMNSSYYYNSYSASYAGTVVIQSSAMNGPVMLACCAITNNYADKGAYGVGIDFEGPYNPTLAGIAWQAFGCLVSTNTASDSGSINMKGRTATYSTICSLVNCTAVDHGLPIQVNSRGGGGNWERDNYLINCIVADNRNCSAVDSDSCIVFKNTLIDPDTPASGGVYFDGLEYGGHSKYVNGGGNITNSQPLFMDQVLKDFRLQETSPAKGTAQALYATNGLGMAFVDVNRSSTYSAGIDVIVDIVQGSGQYLPAAGEYYYPRDMNGERWLSSSRYSSNSSLVGKFSMGALAPKSRRGLVITLK